MLEMEDFEESVLEMDLIEAEVRVEMLQQLGRLWELMNRNLQVDSSSGHRFPVRCTICRC